MIKTNNRKIIVVVLVVALFASVVLSLFFLSSLLNRSNRENQTIKPTPINENPTAISPLQRTRIGATRDSDVVNNFKVIEKSTLPSGETQYSIESQLIPRPEKIITERGVVVFESILIPITQSDRGFVSLDEITSTFGEPDTTITGSNFYGWYVENRIYSSKGFTIIGNPNTNEIFEIHIYSPMSYTDYLSKYGEDINPNLSPHTEVY
jgi:hypothetical protein